MIKTLTGLEIQGLPQVGNIILNGKGSNAFLIRLGTKHGFLLS